MTENVVNWFEYWTLSYSKLGGRKSQLFSTPERTPSYTATTWCSVRPNLKTVHPFRPGAWFAVWEDRTVPIEQPKWHHESCKGNSREMAEHEPGKQHDKHRQTSRSIAPLGLYRWTIDRVRWPKIGQSKPKKICWNMCEEEDTQKMSAYVNRSKL